MDRPDQTSPIAPPRRITGSEIAALLVIGAMFALATLPSWIAPEILFGAVRRFGVSMFTGGSLVFAEGILSGVLSIAFGIRPPSTPKRCASLGIMIYAACNLLSPHVANFGLLLCLRACGGVANALMMYAAVSLISARTSNHDRSFALLNAAANASGAAILTGWPLLWPVGTGLDYVTAAGLFGAVAVPLVFVLLPAGRASDTEMSARPSSSIAIGDGPGDRRTLALLVLLLIATAVQTNTVFTFGPAIGARLGVASGSVDAMLGIAALGAVAGPFLVTLLGAVLGRPAMAAVTILVLTCSNAWLGSTADSGHLMPALVVNMTLSYLVATLLLAWSADLDPSGRYGTIMVGTLATASAITPLASGALLDRFGVGAVTPLALVTGVCALLIVAALAAGSRMPARGTAGH